MILIPSTVAEAKPVEYIMTEVNHGWLFRSYRWSASMMVLMMILTFSCISTGGLKPRELTWATGVTLAVTTVSFGVTGYSLLDQVDTACKIVTGVQKVLVVVVY